MSKLEAIIALENQVENDIAAAKKAKDALLEQARLDAKKVIDDLKSAQQKEIDQLQSDAKKAVEAIELESSKAKEKLHKKIETDYKGVTSKYLELLKKEVITK